MEACGYYTNISVALTTNMYDYTKNVYEFAIYGVDSYGYTTSAYVLWVQRLFCTVIFYCQ